MECYQCRSHIYEVGYGHFTKNDGYIENRHPGIYFCLDCASRAREATRSILEIIGKRIDEGVFPMTCPVCNNIIILETGKPNTVIADVEQYAKLKKLVEEEMTQIREQGIGFLPTLEGKRFQWIEVKLSKDRFFGRLVILPQ